MATRAFAHWLKRAIERYAHVEQEGMDIASVTVQRDLSVLIKFHNGDRVYLVQLVQDNTPLPLT